MASARRLTEHWVTIEEECREIGVTELTYDRRKMKYGGLRVGEVRRLGQFEEENRQLKELVADLSMDKQLVQDALRRKF